MHLKSHNSCLQLQHNLWTILKILIKKEFRLHAAYPNYNAQNLKHKKNPTSNIANAKTQTKICTEALHKTRSSTIFTDLLTVKRQSHDANLKIHTFVLSGNIFFSITI